MNSTEMKISKKLSQFETIEEYRKVYQDSLENSEKFWHEVAHQKVKWHQPWSQVSDCDYHSGKVRWYLDAQLNVAENCLDRHIQAGKGNHKALIWVGNDLDEERIYTFQQVYEEVCRLANALERLGIQKGDRVVIYLPNIPELAFSVLACARMGVIHSVIFGGFSATSIRNRVEDCQAKLIITANGTYRGSKWVDLKTNVDEAMAAGCHSVQHVAVFPRSTQHSFIRKKYDLSWDEFMPASLSTSYPAISHSSEDPLFILYTSGSTGKPKGVLHKMGGYLTYVAYTYEAVFQPNKNDVFWCTADVGWITGHSYLIYGPLANGITTLMYEGIPTHPDPGRFWQVVDRYQVSIFYTAPTAIRILASSGDHYAHKHSRRSLRTLGSVGEPISPEAWRWYHDVIGSKKCPIVDTWWQTETGGVLISPLAGITPTKPGSATLPLPGIEPLILDAAGKPIEGEGSGALVIARSWPGQMTEVYGDSQRFYNTYFTQFPGYYCTGDGAYRDSEGYFWITGRTDDVIKVSGHRLGTAEIESACMTHPLIAEAAVVGVPDAKTGEAIHIFAVTKTEKIGEEAHFLEKLWGELIAAVRKEVGPLATPQKIYWVPGIPKTRSGKIMRRLLRKMASGDFETLGDTSTLADPGIIDHLIEHLRPVLKKDQ